MRITFVLPGTGTGPSGGPKVVYEYANALVRRGHRVAVVHPAWLGTERKSVFQFAKKTIRYVQRRIDGSYRPKTWFQVDPRVQLLWMSTLHARNIPEGDIIVATYWHTAEWVSKYPPSKGRKFYLIQGHEIWDGFEDRVMATWRLPLHKIVIARWLQEMAYQMGEKVTYIPNGLDFSAFGMDIDPQMRDPNRVMMLYGHQSLKGSADGLAALRLAHAQIPTLKADLFGVPSAPADLPPWICYHRNPPQVKLRQLYNQAAIFLAPSWTEGWGLTASEALQCGCALVATDIGGHREFCIPNTTALLNPPKDSKAMADNLLALLQNQEQRIRLARTGNEYIQQFTWGRAVDAFEAALCAVSSM
jgi:glycosyltransferase involved in cell wall biosynthesis